MALGHVASRAESSGWRSIAAGQKAPSSEGGFAQIQDTVIGKTNFFFLEASLYNLSSIISLRNVLITCSEEFHNYSSLCFPKIALHKIVAQCVVFE